MESRIQRPNPRGENVQTIKTLIVHRLESQRPVIEGPAVGTLYIAAALASDDHLLAGRAPGAGLTAEGPGGGKGTVRADFPGGIPIGEGAGGEGDRCRHGR